MIDKHHKNSYIFHEDVFESKFMSNHFGVDCRINVRLHNYFIDFSIKEQNECLLKCLLDNKYRFKRDYLSEHFIETSFKYSDISIF